MTQTLKQSRGGRRLALAFGEDQLEQRGGGAQGRVAGTQDQPVRQAFDNQRRQPRLEMKEPAHQADAVTGVMLQRQHGHARLLAGQFAVGGARQPVLKVTQQEHRITRLQGNGLGLAGNVQPAMALHHQVKTGPCQALGAGVPATAITPDMEQAGV
ncbi:hypothetical protein D3C75_905170 [compost metagenome]